VRLHHRIGISDEGLPEEPRVRDEGLPEEPRVRDEGPPGEPRDSQPEWNQPIASVADSG
jgi:hypothetical protein